MGKKTRKEKSPAVRTRDAYMFTHSHAPDRAYSHACRRVGMSVDACETLGKPVQNHACRHASCLMATGSRRQWSVPSSRYDDDGDGRCDDGGRGGGGETGAGRTMFMF